MDLRDFEAEVRFFNPYEGFWDVNLFFRIGGNKTSHLEINSSRQWTLFLSDSAGSNKVAEGRVTNWDLSGSGSNHIKLVANGNRGDFYANGQLVTTLDLSGNLESGDVSIATGITGGNSRPGAVTRYEGFAVRPLQPSGTNPPPTGPDCSGIPAAINMEISPSNCAPAGASFKFVGRGFSPGEIIGVYATAPDGEVIGADFQVEADGNGATSTVTLNTDAGLAPGIYALTMEGVDSHRKAIGYVKLTSP